MSDDLEFISSKSLARLEERLSDVEEQNLKAANDAEYASTRHWIAYVVLGASTTMFLLVFTGVGDLLGFKAGWVLSEAAAVRLEDGSLRSDAVVAATRNMITVIAPIVLGIVVWLITITAERRLKTYDETMQRFRGEIREGMTEARETTLATVQGSIKEQVREAIEAEKSRMDKAIAEYREDLRAETGRVAQIREVIEARFGHIADTTAYAKQDSSFGDLTSVGAVHHKVTELFRDGDRAQVVTLVREMLDMFHRADAGVRPSGSLKGDWFNLSAELGRNDEEGLALEVCLAGLQQQAGAPLFDEDGQLIARMKGRSLDDDVLAHAVQYAQTINDTRLADLLSLNGYDAESCTGQPEWGWRSYSFTIKALDSLGRHDEAIKLGQHFLKTVPLDGDTSKVVSSLMTVMAAHGDRKGAIELAFQWLEENPKAPGAQMITQLLDWLDADENVERFIALASRGIRDLAQEQPSANMGNFLYRRALARDKRVLNAIYIGDDSDIDICDEISKALTDYKMALATQFNTGLFKHITERQEILRRAAQEQGCDDGDVPPPGGGSGPPPSGGSAGGAGLDGPSADPSDAVKQQIVALLPILANDEMSPLDRAEAIQAKLAGLDPMTRRLTYALLDHMKDDDDSPDELREALRAVWPHLSRED